MRAFSEGREVLADYTLYTLMAALFHSNPLSLDYALDLLVLLIEAAIDEDPATKIESMSSKGLLASEE